VLHEEVLLFSNGPGEIVSLSLKDGSLLWENTVGNSGHQSTYDLLVADGLVWGTKFGSWRTLTGRDPVTGEDKKVFPPGNSDWFHHRCHRGRATDNYLMMSLTGIEYIDLETGTWQPNPWVRGACLYGVMPANGLTYAPPHSCGCYIESKLSGFNALAGEAPKSTKQDTVRLVTGPAYGKVSASSGGDGDWPTYRSDNKRSGSTSTEIPTDLKESWKADLGGKLSPVTIADGRLFVTAVERHMVYALDSTTGKELWSFTAEGRVDSPPTIYGDMAIFGCRDGWVYCLRTRDGKQVWRYRAAPQERWIVSYEQLESVWPVNGAVLVQDGSVYGVAGRSMFLDGGLHLFKLNALTGEKEFEEVMDDKIPGSGKPLDTTAQRLDMPVALPDILSSDGKNLYMRSQVIGLDGKRPNINATKATDQGGEDAHLICSSGFLDDNWFHRAYWVFGRGYGTGHNGWFRAGRFAPAGRMLVFNDDNVFGYGRLPNMYVWSSVLEYQLYSAKKEVTPEAISRVSKANKQQESKKEEGGHGHEITFDRDLYGSYPLEEISAIAFNWRNADQPLQARAMALTDGKLIIAGPPDVLDENEIFATPFDEKVMGRAKDQIATLEGKQGALLQVISTGDGSKLREIKLDSMPVFDGMAAANGNLYISTVDGQIICLD
jgi:outer membrane protein assembly factor BamB